MATPQQAVQAAAMPTVAAASSWLPSTLLESKFHSTSQPESHTSEPQNAPLIPKEQSLSSSTETVIPPIEKDLPSSSSSPTSPATFTYNSTQNSQPQSQARTQNSFSSSPRPFSTELTSSIPEECDETESESPNEPITPISGSGRPSRDFHAVEQHDTHLPNYTNSVASSTEIPEQSELPITQTTSARSKPLLAIETATVPPKSLSTAAPTPTTATPYSSDKAAPPPLQRRPSTPRAFIRRTSSQLGFKMTSMFKRSSSNVTESATKEFREVNYGANDANDTNGSTPLKATPNSSRHFTFQKSSGTTRSNTPPSPGSPLEMASASKQNVMQPTVPSVHDFFDNQKKNRSSTGFSLRNKINFASNNANKQKPTTRRVKSLERKNEKELKAPDLTHHMWAMTPAAGTGIKARRLSLSLPDDFTVDVAELLKEFEYQSKLLGRHGKHLGKGATSKVTLMVRKGAPGELYAVKEFRGKTSTDTSEEYEKKIKSEFSVAKSLHHPNIVETIRLCTDHGRWNHVMEYCSEGDLFSLVSKKYLQEEGRAKDRLCLFKQLLQGVNYLHSNGIAHRDIKLENLLITKDSKLKITDFGVSEVFCGIHPGLREAGGQCGQGMGEIRLCEPGLCGSMPYIAPEVLAKDKPYDPRPLDVWSSAIVMIYLTFGANLWEKASIAGANAKGNDNYSKLVRAWDKLNAKKAKNPELNKDAYPHVDAFDYCIEQLVLRRLLLNMLNPDPEKRITMSEIINNRWMKNSVECCQLESYDDPTKFIDASKKDAMKNVNGQKIYCHNHLPMQSTGHALPPMPGKAGY